MKIKGTVALVTGANRGIGLAFTRELLARGARKVHAGARDPSTVVTPGVYHLDLRPFLGVLRICSRDPVR